MKILMSICILLMLASTMVWADPPPPPEDPFEGTYSDGIFWAWFFTDGYAYHHQCRTSGFMLVLIYKVTDLGSYIFMGTINDRWDQPLGVAE